MPKRAYIYAFLVSLICTLGPAQAGAAEITVMLLSSNPGNNDQLRNALDAHPGIDWPLLFDGAGSTPTELDLLGVDAVFVHASTAWHDNVAVGDLLADYVDHGGGLVMDVAAFSPADDFEIRGRLKTDGYVPMEAGFPPIGPATLGDFIQGHPIMADVTSAETNGHSDVTLHEGAQTIASWTDDEQYVATLDNIVALNAFHADYNFNEDAGLLAGNACCWSWAIIQPAQVDAIDPDSTENDGVTSVEITGDFFINGQTAATLSGPAKADIQADNLVVENMQTINCDFELNGAEAGVYDLLVDNGNGETALEDAFTITQAADDDDDDDDGDEDDDDDDDGGCCG